jgi:hypothetical protein
VAKPDLVFQIATPENDEGVKWRKTKGEHRFLSARRGNMLRSPFQCDFCWFVNITKRCTNDIFEAEKRLLGYIQRVNLDMMWSYEPSTALNTNRLLEKGK